MRFTDILAGLAIMAPAASRTGMAIVVTTGAPVEHELYVCLPYFRDAHFLQLRFWQRTDPIAGYICSFTTAAATSTVINDCRDLFDRMSRRIVRDFPSPDYTALADLLRCVSSNPNDSSAGYFCSFSSATAATTASAVINDCRNSTNGCHVGQ